MRILLHDYSGHPFQVQLARELSRRGHQVTHSFCEAYTSGKGHVVAEPGESIVFDPIGVGRRIDKTSFARRLFQEIGFGIALINQARRVRPDVVMAANTPIPTLLVFAAYALVSRLPWVLWHQDVQAVAIRSFAGGKLNRAFAAVGAAVGLCERWCARRAAAVVVIAESFVDVHRRWGTVGKTIVIPNWAPLDEIVPVDRHNEWSREQGLDDTDTVLYSGTLGLKHDPELLVGLTRVLIDTGHQVRLVVVNEGPAVPVLRAEAERLEVPITLLPFQPYERLSEVLGSGDVLVVLLEQDAGAFSVPSKTLSYLCAGRPVLGLMPADNSAATLVGEADGRVLAPREESLDDAARWIGRLLDDREDWQRRGRQARALAERDFALAGCADRFEGILRQAAARDSRDVTHASA